MPSGNSIQHQKSFQRQCKSSFCYENAYEYIHALSFGNRGHSIC